MATRIVFSETILNSTLHILGELVEDIEKFYTALWNLKYWRPSFGTESFDVYNNGKCQCLKGHAIRSTSKDNVGGLNIGHFQKNIPIAECRF